MKEEDWGGEADDNIESFDSTDAGNELEVDEQRVSSLSTKKQKVGVTNLRRRIEDRLENKRLRKAFEFDDNFSDDYDEPFGRLG